MNSFLKYYNRKVNFGIYFSFIAIIFCSFTNAADYQSEQIDCGPEPDRNITVGDTRYFMFLPTVLENYEVSPVSPTTYSDITGLEIDEVEGILSWTPTASQTGIHNIKVTAEDRGNSPDSTLPVKNNLNDDVTVNNVGPQPVQYLHCYATISVYSKPNAPTQKPVIVNDFHPVSTNYTISLPIVSGTYRYELFEAIPSALNAYNSVAYITPNATVTKSQSQIGTYRYKYRTCNAGNTCSELSPYREISIYAEPAMPSSLVISPTAVIEGNDFTVSWGASAGLEPSAGGRIKLYQRIGTGSETLLGSYTGAGSKIIAASQVANYQYRVVGCNPNIGCSAGRSANINVTMANRAPTLAAISNQVAHRQQQLVVFSSAQDPNNDNLTFSLPIKPVGMSINPGTGQITWTPSVQSVGNNNVTVQVTDGSLNATRHFVVTVLNSFPQNVQLAALAPTSLTLGQSINLAATANDVDNNISSITICYGLINSTSQCNVAVSCTFGATENGSSCAQYWTPPAVNYYYLWAQASDGTATGFGTVKSTIRTLTVVAPNQAPTTTIIAPTATDAPFSLGSNVQFVANTQDIDGEVAMVKFYINGILETTKVRACGTSVGETYQFEHNWLANAAGTYQITVAAYDCENSLVSNSSSPVSFTVLALQPPTGVSEVTRFTEQEHDITVSSTGNYLIHFSSVPNVTKYRIYQNDALLTGVISAGINSKQIANQPAGTYEYCIQVGNSSTVDNGWGTISSDAQCKSITVLRPLPNAPQFTPLTVTQTGSYQLSWPNNDTNTSYFILAKKAGTIDSNAPWVTIDDHNLSGSKIITNPEPGLSSYQLSACNIDQQCQVGQQLTINTQAPYLSSATNDSCGDSCLSLQGLGFDPSATVALTNMANGQAWSHLNLTFHDPQHVTLDLSQEILDAAQHLGVAVTIVNPNGATTGIIFSTVAPQYRLSLTDAAPVLSADDVIYAGNGDQLIALDVASGTSIEGWPKTLDGDILAAPAIDANNGNIYIGTTGKHLYAFNPQGEQQWLTNLRGSIVSGVVLDENSLLYVGAMDSALYALNQAGTIEWQYPLSAPIAQSPVLFGNGLIYVTTIDNQYHVIDRQNLGPDALRWQDIDDSLINDQIDLSGWQPSQDEIDNGQLYVVGRLFYALLGRAPTEQELTFWAYSLVWDASLTEIVDAFLVSDTGANNFPVSLTHEQFLTTLYDRLFINNWPNTVNGVSFEQLLAQLNDDASRADIVLILTNSLAYSALVDPTLNRVFFYLYDFCFQSNGCEFHGDSDGDGLSDQFEWDNGLDPLNPLDGRLGATQLTISQGADNSQLSLQWLAVPRSTYYQIYQAQVGQNFVLVNNDVQDLAQNIAPAAGLYRYKVKACHTVFCSEEFSNEVNATVGGGIDITITYPVVDQDHSQGDNLVVRATTSAHTQASMVRFSLDGQQWFNSSDSTSPYSHSFGSQLLVGSYTLSVMAIDNNGNQTTRTQIFNIVGDSAGTPEQVPAIASTSAAPADLLSDTIGLTAGSFRVDESGAATYSMPLSVPSGIAGVTPQISLNYHSSGGNGPLGIGWSVGGLSGISRCRQTIEQDGQSAPFTLTNTDRFCLDGQKLLAINGSYGENGTEYRTELSSKTRVMSYGDVNGPRYFTVQREDGSTTFYGDQGENNTSHSDAILVINEVGFSWLKNSVIDNMGNAINYHYRRNVTPESNNEIAIDYIEYSDNIIQFNYQTTAKLNFSTQHLFGHKVTTTALLDNIVIGNHQGMPVRSYVLEYDQDSTNPLFDRLKRIHECDGTTTATVNNCLKPIDSEGFLTIRGSFLNHS